MGTAGQHWKRVWRRTVTGSDVASNDVPRVDEPPYEITVPPCDDDGRNSLFLCENMPARPSLAFEQWAIGGPVFEDEGLARSDTTSGTEFYAALLTDEADLDRLSRSTELIEETDFTSEALLVVQTGYGSSSIVPHVKRIETTDDGIHAFGCHDIPCARTEDVTVRAAVVRFDRPETLESAVVSLTIWDDTRVTFSDDDGIVTVEDGEIVDDTDADLPRVDEPPYGSCDAIPTEPTLRFAQQSAGTLEEALLPSYSDVDTANMVSAALFTDESDLDQVSVLPEVLRGEDFPAEDEFDRIDFTTEAALQITFGFRPSNVDVRVQRVEETDDGVHVFACHRDGAPIPTPFPTSHSATVRFERPETLESVVVTLTLDSERRVTYTVSDGLVSVEDGEAIVVDEEKEEPDLPRIDEPPYEITEPSCGDGRRDPHWLCENVPAEPSLAFEQETTGTLVLQDEGIDWLPERDVEGQQSQYYAALLTDEDDLERVDRESGGDAVALLEETDFASEAALVVQSGWGSSSTPPHLERIAATDDGVRADGCHAEPCDQTDDVTVRTVVARFERPDALESGVVRLITDPETRVNFRASDGVVTIADGDVV